MTGIEQPVEALRFPVEGMTCGSCINRISRALGRLEGVRGVRVDLNRELVTVQRELGTASEVAIADAIEATGYHARMHEAASVEVVPSLLRRLLRR